jgi:hypothetical protein
VTVATDLVSNLIFTGPLAWTADASCVGQSDAFFAPAGERPETRVVREAREQCMFGHYFGQHGFIRGLRQFAGVAQQQFEPLLGQVSDRAHDADPRGGQIGVFGSICLDGQIDPESPGPHGQHITDPQARRCRRFEQEFIEPNAAPRATIANEPTGVVVFYRRMASRNARIGQLELVARRAPDAERIAESPVAGGQRWTFDLAHFQGVVHRSGSCPFLAPYDRQAASAYSGMPMKRIPPERRPSGGRCRP